MSNIQIKGNVMAGNVVVGSSQTIHGDKSIGNRGFTDPANEPEGFDPELASILLDAGIELDGTEWDNGTLIYQGVRVRLYHNIHKQPFLVFELGEGKNWGSINIDDTPLNVSAFADMIAKTKDPMQFGLDEFQKRLDNGFIVTLDTSGAMDRNLELAFLSGFEILATIPAGGEYSAQIILINHKKYLDAHGEKTNREYSEKINSASK